MANAFFKSSTDATDTDFGQAATGLDLNNDGVSDSIFGAAQMGTGNGLVTVLYGDAGGFDPDINLATLPPAAGFSIAGAGVDDEFGYVLAAATNLDGSGNDALLIGARGAGAVSVVLGGSTTVDFTVTGLPAFADGIALAGLGDFNGDGIGDFAIGAPDASSGAGAVYVIYGAAGLNGTVDVGALDGTNGFVLGGFDANDNTGASLAGLGDFNGDTFNDLLIGAPGDDDDGTNAGTSYILYGTGSAAAAEAITTTSLTMTSFTGASAGDTTGASVSGGFDVNGNGIPDALISAPLADPNGASSGAVYVVFDATAPTQIDLATLDGTNGFAIRGLAAQDMLGASAQMLGDITGDGIGDIGIATQSGDVFLIFGTATNTGGVVDLSTLDGNTGMALTGLFDTPPTSISLAALGDINADSSGPIGDLAIAAYYDDGTPGQTISVLGGGSNLLALDAADGAIDGTIAFDQITGPVDFVATNQTITITGDATGSMTEDDPSTTGAIGIIDATGPDPTFAGRSASGSLGVFLVNSAGDLWTYTVNDNAALQYLDAGTSITDSASLIASNGTQRKVTVTINGTDDRAIAIGDLGVNISEDIARFKGTIALTDVDLSDNPSLAGISAVGTYGKIVVADDGTYTYFLTSAEINALGAGESRTETLVLTAPDGSTHVVSAQLVGSAEGIPLTFDNTDNEIYTSFGDDIINALGGNDFIDAGAGNDTVNAGDDNDTVRDAVGNDIVNAGNGNDDVALLSGNNIVTGGAGHDIIKTGFQDDVIDAGAGNDVIAADEGGGFLFGNNTITGGAGDDVMKGGAGVDTFIFAPNDGTDVIADFDASLVVQTAAGIDVLATGPAFQIGIDKIALSGFSTSTTNDVMGQLTSTTDGAQFSAQGTTVLLRDVLLSDLSETDFVFM